MNDDIAKLEQIINEYVVKPKENPEQASMTLTWAQSIDGAISAGRGVRTKLSGSHSHKMTHYLRTLHDAILVGRGTVEADDPKLNCRYPGFSGHLRPIILDSQLKWPAEQRQWAVLEGAKAGTGHAPWVLTTVHKDRHPCRVAAIEAVGGAVHTLEDLNWETVLKFLAANQIRNVMVEGGAEIICSALHSRLCHCMIVTVAPTFLGRDGVHVSPLNRTDFKNVQWWSEPGVADAVVLARQV